MSLRHSYTLIAPFYDAAIAAATAAPVPAARHGSGQGADEVLVSGVGTGLDLPHLPAGHDYVGLDFTAAMLHRSRPAPGATTTARFRATRCACPSVTTVSIARSCT